MALAESDRSRVWKLNRWLGLRFGYLFYHLQLSANMLSAARVALALCGFYLLSRAGVGHVWEPVFGLILIAWQVNLDFADGAIARAQKEPSAIGMEMDGLPNELSRMAVLVLLGIYTQNTILILVSVAISSILIGFLEKTMARMPAQGVAGLVKTLARRLVSVVFMLIVLPTVLSACRVLGIPLAPLACVLLGIYGLLAVVWMGICTVKM